MNKLNITSHKYKRQDIHKLTIFIILFFSFNKTYSASDEYKSGYIDCIINEIIPEGKLKYYIKNEHLIIHSSEIEINPSIHDMLIRRLKKQIFLKK